MKSDDCLIEKMTELKSSMLDVAKALQEREIHNRSVQLAGMSGTVQTWINEIRITYCK